jgi:nucleotide-binding universal stress UspA family protein
MSTQNGTSQSNSSKSVIVVGVDFSSLSNEALRTGADLARTSNSELHVVHVMPHPAGDPLSASEPNLGLAFAKQTDQIRESLHELVDPMIDGIKSVCLHIRVGVADREITQLASDIGADLDIVGTHGRTGLDRLLMGSVAESVVRHAPCPVYTFRPKTVALWEKIEPPCPDCTLVQEQSGRSKLWCELHSRHHPRAHTYHEVPRSYGMGAQTFREPS